MGLSASQARLLSITSRLSDNELRSQSITNAKSALSTKTSQASQEYLNSLNETKMTFSTYDANGNKTKTKLTGAALSQYAPLKNQYTLVNSDGQALVSELDATNYKESANISEFLEKYGFSNIFEEKVSMVTNQGKYAKANEEYQKEYNDWLSKKPKVTDYTKTKEVASTNNEIYQAVLSSGGCLGYTVDGDKTHEGCFMHVLSDLIGPGKVTTSDGHTYTIYATGSAGNESCDHGNGWCWNTAAHPRGTFDKITEKLKKGHCSGDVIEGGSQKETLTINGQEHEVTVGGPTSNKNMTLWQRCVDLLWEVHGEYQVGNIYGGKMSDETLEKVYYYIQHDLKQAEKETITVTNWDKYNEAVEDWKKTEPDKPDEEDFKEEVASLDQTQKSDEGQWYINLWHRMNGASNYKVTINGVDNGEHDPKSDGVISGDNIKSPTNGLTENGKVLWTVLEDGLMNSDEWLNYALKNRVVTMERVNYTNPTENGTGIKEYTWTSIIYSNALDISEEENEKAITEAEVKYKQALSDIESKDKQYDNIIRRLDTEHNALQTEYESVKSVITKNLERTLKMYS